MNTHKGVMVLMYQLKTVTITPGSLFSEIPSQKKLKSLNRYNGNSTFSFEKSVGHHWINLNKTQQKLEFSRT